MDVLEALGGWRNINQEKLDQIKVDNPPLYNAITKAINLLAKKYGGEDIVIEKPIEVVEEKATTIESEAESDYAFLKRIEILNLTKGVYVERNDIVDSMMREINLDLISVREKYELAVQQKLDYLDAMGLVVGVGRSVGDTLYRISNAGQALIDKYELQNKQVKESYDLEGFDGFAAYLRNVKKLTEKKGDWITIEEYTKEYLPLVPSMTFDESFKANEQILKYLANNGLILIAQDEYLVSDKGEALLAKNPEIFVEALPTTPTPPPSQATTQISEEDRYMNIIKTILICKIKFGRNPDSNESYKEFRLTNVVPITYDFISNFLPDLSKLYVDDLIEINSGILEVTLKGKTMLQNYLESKGKFGDFISEIEVLTAQSKTNQPTPTPAQPAPTPTNLRPSPTDSATMYPTGTTKIGNDGNEWRVTENKNGVKRWVKVGEISTSASEEPQYDLPQDRLEGVLKRLSEAMSKTNDYVTISELYEKLYDVVVPINYTKFGLSGEPSLEKDFEVMERMGLVKSRKTTFGKEYYIDTKGSEMLTQLKFEEAQKQKEQILAQAQISKTPEFSQEPPISEIEEDEVDLDILEQQLNDDSLEFDITDEDLENLEF